MIEYDYENFDFDYLCPHCGGVLFVDTANPPNDVCINEKCQLWPKDLNSIIDATETEEPGIFKEIQEKEKTLIDEVNKWQPGKLARHAYMARRELITPLFTKGILPFFDHFIALGELLLMTNKYASEGTLDDIGRFRLLLDDFRSWGRDQRNLEDVQNKRIIFGRTGSGLKPYSLKYAKAIVKFQKEIGLVNTKDLPSIESSFPYEHLIAAVTPELDFPNMTDGNQILEPFWFVSLQLRYCLQEHYRTKMQYNYTPDLLDFTVLFGWWIQIYGRDELSIIPIEKQEKEIEDLQRHFDAQAEGKYSAHNFFGTYVDSTELVPIVVRTPEGTVMDHHTLFFFLIYLQGCPDPKELVLKERGQIIENMRGKVGEKFESWLRDEIRKRGYTGPETAVTESYEYDILAVSEAKKTIIVADAKYRDMAPSSFTGTNILAQELLGDHALKYEADRQQKRLDHFRNNIEQFRKYLKPEHEWGEYNILGFLVTKQIPLAHRYKEVMIIQATELLQKAA